MLYNILAVGDVVGENGLAHLERCLRPLQRQKGAHFTVVNGENAAGVGLTPQQAWRIYDAGADAVTLGNHTFGKMQITELLEDVPWLLRPANYTGRAPGRGVGLFDLGAAEIRVINLIGRCDLAWGADNPFTKTDAILKEGKPTFTLVDFHAEATSEKLAMGYYLDGRVSALWGTHTHVPTADGRVLPKGMGYQTDLGMCGAVESVLGIEPRQSIESFLGPLPLGGGALQAGGLPLHPGQRHRPLHRCGAPGHPLSVPQGRAPIRRKGSPNGRRYIIIYKE